MNHRETVLVTGAASGIGKATAEKYLAEGYNVIGLDLTPINTSFKIITCDISDEMQIRSVMAYISEHYDNISYLINCAGIFFHEHRYDLEHMEIKEWDQTLRVNLTGTMMMIKHTIPLLYAASGDRAIVNVSSDQAEHPRERNSAYAVSKSGINCLTKVAACELLKKKIRVNAVEAASVETNFIRSLAKSDERMRSIYQKENDKMPLGLIPASDIANICYFLGSPKSTHITGQTILIDSGLYL